MANRRRGHDRSIGNGLVIYSSPRVPSRPWQQHPTPLHLPVIGLRTACPEPPLPIHFSLPHPSSLDSAFTHLIFLCFILPLHDPKPKPKLSYRNYRLWQRSARYDRGNHGSAGVISFGYAISSIVNVPGVQAASQFFSSTSSPERGLKQSSTTGPKDATVGICVGLIVQPKHVLQTEIP